MPSSLIFAGLVVIWLLILVPAVARHQQEVARLSPAALSGRVLDRPHQRRRTQEVDQVDQAQEPRPVTTRPDSAEQTARVPAARTEETRPADAPVLVGAGSGAGPVDAEPPEREADDRFPAEDDERRWERPPPRYRPGRGGFDPEAAALAARARYAVRQRIVLTLLALAGISAIVAWLALPAVWWLHLLVDLALVGYLVYLRRQVRMEEAIRARRAARMAGPRRPPAADDPELDEWARRGREAGRARPATTDDLDDAGEDLPEDLRDDLDGDATDVRDDLDEDVDDSAWTEDADDDDPERVRGTGEPVGVLSARPRTVTPPDGDDADEPEAALPRLNPAPPPPLPAGTTLVEVDEEDVELSELDSPGRPDYRRAAGE
ncbi:gephyrin-like molybdotransferase receptor GlpR [Pseudonocardia sp. H11422]|uniref:divisome protein SepX/GlpR n=1 Tax=Pseudonocardia sp. H11422 TaxID=2835866 RepID=UPI001BDD0C76|nr:gephyrin-like molybdotransferase receptor GlpR [Pseudonocardia sp. H11422]